jgi:hypothetical protein
MTAKAAEEQMPDESMAGGCACGRVRFTANITNDEAYLCHCRMCQRATGSVSIAFTLAKKADVAWHGEPDYYVSSAIARRPYCASCGTSLGFEHPDSERMDLTVASFDDPSRFVPKHHFGVESMHHAWLNTEALPRYRADDYQPLIDRWIAATGKMPA